MNLLKFCFAALILDSAFSSIALASNYDVVINNGRVIDPETMYDQVANVGIDDGEIVAITSEEITGDDTIEASGLVVAPGFINTHYHAIDPFGVRMALRDGVTTGMDLDSHVLINGKVALRDGEVVDVSAGQPIRYPVEREGRFVPVDVNKWLDAHAIKTPDVLGIDDTGATKVIKQK